VDRERRPEVTLVSSTAPPRLAVEPVVRPPRRRTPLLVLGGLVAAVAVGSALSGSPAAEVPAGPPAELVVRSAALTVTQGGVLVVPLELRNPGERLAVRAAEVYASPVLTDPSVQAPDAVEPADRRRFVALVAPDCALLRATGAAFSAGVTVDVGRGSADQRLTVDLSADPVIADRVAGLCA
jgi:hypothetical protein